MSSFDGQNTDRENSKPKVGAKNAGDDLKTSSRGSAQSIALESPVQSITTDGGVTAPLPAGD